MRRETKRLGGVGDGGFKQEDRVVAAAASIGAVSRFWTNATEIQEVVVIAYGRVLEAGPADADAFSQEVGALFRRKCEQAPDQVAVGEFTLHLQSCQALFPRCVWLPQGSAPERGALRDPACVPRLSCS